MPGQKPPGRNIEIDLREVVNAILYINRAGCQWDILSHDFPNYKTVNWYYNLWRREGLWDKMMASLRDAVRATVNKASTPTVACIDSKTAKTSNQGGAVGYDRGKSANGRKRHIVVDVFWTHPFGHRDRCQHPRCGCRRSAVASVGSRVSQYWIGAC